VYTIRHAPIVARARARHVRGCQFPDMRAAPDQGPADDHHLGPEGFSGRVAAPSAGPTATSATLASGRKRKSSKSAGFHAEQHDADDFAGLPLLDELGTLLAQTWASRSTSTSPRRRLSPEAASRCSRDAG